MPVLPRTPSTPGAVLGPGTHRMQRGDEGRGGILLPTRNTHEMFPKATPPHPLQAWGWCRASCSVPEHIRMLPCSRGGGLQE